MKFSVREIIRFVAGKHFRDHPYEDVVKAALINTLIFSAPSGYFMILQNHLKGEDTTMETIIQSGIVTFFVLIWIFFRVTRKINVTTWVMTLLLTAALDFVFLVNSSLNSGPFWLFGFPVFVLLLLGFKRGRWLLFLNSIGVIALSYLLLGQIDNGYTVDFLGRFVFIYLFFTFYVVAYVHIRNELERDLSEANTQIARNNEELETTLERQLSLNEQLQKNELKLRRTQDMGNVAVWEWDVVNNTLEIGDGVFIMLGLNPEEGTLTKATLMNMLNPYDLEKNLHAVEAAKDQENIPVIQRLRTPKGRNMTIACNLDVSWSAEGKPEYVLGVISDISDLKAGEVSRMGSIVAEVDKERKRIAQELHDSLGQSLIACSMHLSMMREEGDKDPEQSLALLEKMVNEAIVEAREISHNLMPKTVQDFGVVVALKNLFEKPGLKSHFKEVRFYCNDEDKRLPEAMESNLYRIAQELLNNTIKHAEASKINCQLIFNTEGFIFMFEDNGKGYDVDAARQKASGLGVNNIFSRVGTFQGDVIIDSGSRGTSVTIEGLL